MTRKRIIVQLVTGELVTRLVWGMGRNVIYVTDDKNYDLLVNGSGGLSLIGAPKEDVFEYRAGEIRVSDLERFRG